MTPSRYKLRKGSMATEKRDPNKLNWLDQLALDHEKVKETSPVVKTRWSVLDYWPVRRAAWNDEYNDWLEAKSVRVSPYYSTKADAEEWVSRHDPAEGATLIIHQENLREFKEQRWVDW